MSSFTTVIPDLKTSGPLVEIHVAVVPAFEAVLAKSGSPAPTPIAATAMIDTGATGCVIQQGIAARLGLNPVGVVPVSTPSSSGVLCAVYPVQLLLPNRIVFVTKAIEAPMPGQHIQCLIGRDALANCVLVYIGYGNQFTLSM